MNLLQSNYINPYVDAITVWQPSLNYVNGQIVTRNNVTYICLSTHTSTTSFITDYFTSALWQSLGSTIGEIKPFGGSIIPSGWLLCDGTDYDKTTYADLYSIIGDYYGSATTTFKVPNLKGRTPIGSGQSTFSTSFINTDVSISTNAITIPTNKTLQTGRAVLYTCTGTPPTGLVNNTTYYAIVLSSSSICLATTLANAIAMNYVAIDITAQGTGTSTLTFSGADRTLGEFGGEESHILTQQEMPAHTHDYSDTYSTQQIWGTGDVTACDEISRVETTTSTGGSITHNNMQPYLTINYIIKY